VSRLSDSRRGVYEGLPRAQHLISSGCPAEVGGGRRHIRTRDERGQARLEPPESCSDARRGAFRTAKLRTIRRAPHARLPSSGDST